MAVGGGSLHDATHKICVSFFSFFFFVAFCIPHFVVSARNRHCDQPSPSDAFNRTRANHGGLKVEGPRPPSLDGGYVRHPGSLALRSRFVVPLQFCIPVRRQLVPPAWFHHPGLHSDGLLLRWRILPSAAPDEQTSRLKTVP